MIADEALVPHYELPDPLAFESGARATSIGEWRARRREIIELFAQHIYGITPDIELAGAKAVLEADDAVLDGAARRYQKRLRLTLDASRIDIDLLGYCPAQRAGSFPAIIIPNLRGNHAVNVDPAIRISKRARHDQPELPSERGVMARRFPIEQIVARGFHLVTFYYGDIVPDESLDFVRCHHPLRRLSNAAPTSK